jgi:hypothetical protein
VYRFDDSEQPPLRTYDFEDSVPVGIWDGLLAVTVADLV